LTSAKPKSSMARLAKREGILQKKRYAQDLYGAPLAVWVFASPWVFRVATPDDAAVKELWLIGVLVAALAISGALTFSVWKAWTNAALGFALVLSPLVWSQGHPSGLVWSTIVSGLLILALAGVAVADHHEILPKRMLAKGDMREGLPELAMPDESEHMAGGWMAADKGPEIVAPTTHVQAPGDTAKG